MENKNTPNAQKSTINENNKIENPKPLTIAEFINEDEIVLFISTNFNSIIAFNKENKKRQKRSKHEYIHSSLTPVISLEGFLKLIIKYTEIEHNTLIVSYLYIIQLMNKENFILEKNNIYLLLLTSAVLAKKVLEDLVSDNSYYCQIGLFTEKELNLAEYSLFSRLDYKVNYTMEEVEQVYNEIFASLPNQRKIEYFQQQNYNVNIDKPKINKNDNKNNI
jgi:hypothetical protein